MPVDPRDTVIRYRVPEHIRRVIWDLATEECVDFQTMAYQLILDGLKIRLIRRSHLQDSNFLDFVQRNSRAPR